MSRHMLPGEDLIEVGIRDLAQGIESVPALLVSIGAPRLRRLGIPVPRPLPSPEQRLYHLLWQSDPDGSHSRYNALVRRLVSFERAAECASSRRQVLKTNVELASPIDFIPVRPGWEERSPFIAREGMVSFHHFDPSAQALAKVERGHAQDVEDIREMIAWGLMGPVGVVRDFDAIEPELYRYPAIDPKSFRRAVEDIFGPGDPETRR